MKQGILIVVDGIDGAGKTTQIDLLSKYLQEKNIPFEVISFPRYEQNIYADLVTRYLEGEFGTISDVNPYLIALAYAGDRLLAKSLIEEWLNMGKIVLANRYVSSSKAHLGANVPSEKREEFMQWVEKLEYQINGVPKEDLTIFLNVDPKMGQQNATKDQLKDIHEESSNHLKNASKIYLELSKAEENWKIIECMEEAKMRSKEDINQDLINILRNKFTNYFR